MVAHRQGLQSCAMHTGVPAGTTDVGSGSTDIHWSITGMRFCPMLARLALGNGHTRASVNGQSRMDFKLKDGFALAYMPLPSAFSTVLNLP